MPDILPDILKTTEEKGLSGEGLSAGEALALVGLPDERLYDIIAVTEKIRRKHKGNVVNLCSIINARSGLCAEDCSFCAQSSRYETGVETFPMVPAEAIVTAAEEADASGASEFSIVASGKGVKKGSELSTVVEAIGAIRAGTEIESCASLGILDKQRLEALKDAGLTSYHHNLETSRAFFPSVCTTHGYDENVKTIETAKEMGFYVCSGGIFGLGEGWEDRVELAAELGRLDVDSIPINFLDPRPGTPLEAASSLTPRTCLKIIALFRTMLPKKDIVICGGREVNLRDLQPLIFAAGGNGMMLGNYLTTSGRDAGVDLKMLGDLGLEPRSSQPGRL